MQVQRIWMVHRVQSQKFASVHRKDRFDQGEDANDNWCDGGDVRVAQNQ
jgi:hypothetical protein